MSLGKPLSRHPAIDSETAFARFVPRQFLELLGRRSISEVELGDHVEKDMTLLFSDIRDFTTLSQSILPAENFRFINSYLNVMEPVVGRHRGIIDKYIGDAIMALFPGSADDGIRSGIDMLRRLVSYNEGRVRAGYAPIRIGIGINSGLVMMGTVGGHGRMDSTVIGEPVNFASRLESMTKVYGTPLIISEHTLNALEDRSAYCIRFIDRLQLKGRAQAHSVYEVFDADPEPLWLAKQEMQHAFDEALAYFHLGYPERALPLLHECRSIAPDDRVVQHYIERCLNEDGHARSEDDSLLSIGWRPEYAVGVDEIDRQHRGLLGEIAVLAKHVGRDDVALQDTLQRLAELLCRHSDTEENLMRRYHYPFAELHGSQHRVYARNAMELRDAIRRGERSSTVLLFQVHLLLSDWLVNHITHSDFHLGNFLQRAGVQ